MTDRYSDDHKITVANGFGNLTLDANVEISGGLAIDGEITGDISFESQAQLTDAESHTVGIPAADFNVGFSSSFVPSTDFTNSSAYLRVEQPNQLFFSVNLSGRIPNGAAVSRLKMFSMADTGNKVKISLYRQTHGDTTGTSIAHVGYKTNTAITGDQSSLIVINNTIDYSNYFYYLTVEMDCSGGSSSSFAYFAGVTITYGSKLFGQ